jgi:(1->4)-alpha-D-glucan 1-alpha-D-glucosylmutase
MRVQQLTGPVTAKGVEDTALYRHPRLVSLNEVGGDPARFGEPLAAFHDKNAERGRRWPGSLLATATHDTKRGEDVRARIDVLSEVPAEWQDAARRWRRVGRRLKQAVDGEPAPRTSTCCTRRWSGRGRSTNRVARGDSPRITAYMGKATKEAKRETGWVNRARRTTRCARSCSALAPGSGSGSVPPVPAAVAAHGMLNSLAQTLLKIAAPGIVDVYRGRAGDLSLVDPDSRRRSTSARRAMLAASANAWCGRRGSGAFGLPDGR